MLYTKKNFTSLQKSTKVETFMQCKTKAAEDQTEMSQV